MAELAGRTALVTGGARGLGRAIAARLHAEGAGIAVLDVPAALDAADLPAAWAAIGLDLTAPDAEGELARHVAGLERLDVLVANAGVVPPWRSVADLDFVEWDQAFALNVRGMALSLKCAARRLCEDEGGAAVLMASINGYRAQAGQALYTATKHAVLGLMRAAAQDLGPNAVRVNALAPGPVLTAALRARIKAREVAGGADQATAIAALERETALGRLATEAEVAEAALYLVSARSAGLTGVCLPIDAGLA